jgi:hypothetical protein
MGVFGSIYIGADQVLFMVKMYRLLTVLCVDSPTIAVSHSTVR